MASSTRGSRGVVACTSIYRGLSTDSASGAGAVSEGTADWGAWPTARRRSPRVGASDLLPGAAGKTAAARLQAIRSSMADARNPQTEEPAALNRLPEVRLRAPEAIPRAASALRLVFCVDVDLGDRGRERDADGRGSLRAVPAKLLRPHEDGLCDGLCRGHGGRGALRHLFLSQDWNAGSGADGRHRENHDAEWRHLWHIHGHRDGHPMLIMAVVAQYMFPTDQ